MSTIADQFADLSGFVVAVQAFLEAEQRGESSSRADVVVTRARHFLGPAAWGAATLPLQTHDAMIIRAREAQEHGLARRLVELRAEVGLMVAREIVRQVTGQTAVEQRLRASLEVVRPEAAQ